jgi:hypothetical protein
MRSIVSLDVQQEYAGAQPAPSEVEGSILARLAFDAVLNSLQGIVFTKVLRGCRFWFSGFKLET